MERFLGSFSRYGSYVGLPDNEDGSSISDTVTKKTITGRSWIRLILWFLLPSFLSRPLRRRYDEGYDEDEDPGALPKPTSTSYLNGLRGIASLIVALQHNTNEYFPANHRGWGDQPEDHYIIQIPFVRLIIHGSFMVAIFFVISGFALTYGLLKRMHSGRADEAIGALPSSVFRRPTRLFLPIVPVLLISNVVMVRANVFYQLYTENTLPPQPTVWAELHHTWREFVETLVAGKGAATMPQAWTLTVEYQGSVLVFLCCLAFARAAPPLRMGLVAAVFCWQWYLGRWQLGLFLAGMVLADLRHLRPKMPKLGVRARTALDMASWIMLVLSLFLGGWPIYGNGGATLGFSYFNWVPTGIVPQQRFWHAVSAIMLVSALENMPGGRIQSWLNSSWVLYLGEISYGLYLVHWMVGMNSLTKGTIVRLRHQPGWSELGAWLVGFSMALPLCIWVGDLHWRFVDQKSVRLAKWLSEKAGI